ncbi:hypothetical protein BV22DRAFT_1112300 [Leucogyrophana mollusca]|uniref:Uncharacterized protein n=1 Tax=Leucogyrophana mollusca TaxID=85980 RepID=A0ACB8BIU5_9AGAM|nr:hypothetical protein BV22DRAFT_1112300 [Leucogyrophana mollusca]
MAAMQAIRKFRLRELKSQTLPPLQPVASPKAPKSKAPQASAQKSTSPLPAGAALQNPFIPTFNPVSGRWAPPKYSLRQQAVLIKKARQSNVLGLLPPGPKLTAAQIAAATPALTATPIEKTIKSPIQAWSVPVEWQGEVKERTVPGADIGNRLYAGRKRMFKGHKWERVAEGRANRRKMLMRDMAKRITRFKQYYKKRRPSPLKPPRTAKSPKLPF